MAVCASVPGFSTPGVAMYLGKPLFVQVMDFLPWKTFHRIVDRYGGDSPDAQSELRREIPRHGLRAADLPRELALYRSVSGGSSRQTFTTWASARR